MQKQKQIRRANAINFLILSLILISPFFLVKAQSLQFVSDLDRSISAESWVLLEVRDNVNQIYGRPLSQHLAQLMQTKTHFLYRGLAPAILESGWISSEQIRARNQSFKSQAVIAGEVIRGPSGVLIRLDLYLGDSGELFASERRQVQDEGIEALKKEVTSLFDLLIARIPYQAVITSRKGEMVTVNAGSKLGLKPNDEIWAIQVVQLERHPRDRFVVQSQVQTLGKIRITQVDTDSSFARITMERSPGILNVATKLFFREPTTYVSPLVSAVNNGTASSPNPNLIPGETLLIDEIPTVGRGSILFGFSGFEQTNTFSQRGAIGGRDSLATTFHANGELWLTENWFIGGDLTQLMAKVPNNFPGSTPGELKSQIFSTKIMGGGQFFLDEITPSKPLHQSPKLQIYGGMELTQIQTASSAPLVLTSFSHGGIFLGVSGQVPWGELLPKPFVTGASFHFYVAPTTNETPVKSGSAKPNFMGLSLFGDYFLKSTFAIRGQFNWQQYNISMGGSGGRVEPVSSASQQIETLMGGVSFYF